MSLALGSRLASMASPSRQWSPLEATVSALAAACDLELVEHLKGESSWNGVGTRVTNEYRPGDPYSVVVLSIPRCTVLKGQRASPANHLEWLGLRLESYFLHSIIISTFALFD